MKKLIIGIILGWGLTVSFNEYQEWEYFELLNNALDIGMERRVKGYSGDQIIKYVERNRSKYLDYINYRPSLWTCRYAFEHSKCTVKFLIRSPIPIKDRPIYKGKYY